MNELLFLFHLLKSQIAHFAHPTLSDFVCHASLVYYFHNPANPT